MTEQKQFLEFLDGLRSYIKLQAHGKFNGKYLAENWDELSEQEQDELISDAFARNAYAIATIANRAIRNKEERCKQH